MSFIAAMILCCDFFFTDPSSTEDILKTKACVPAERRESLRGVSAKEYVLA